MKVVILAGGMQSTIVDGNEGKPKPMAEIGEKPILWHIMKFFSEQGFRDFIICGGYKVNNIKEYFMDFYIYQSDITVDLQKNIVEIHKKKTEDWNVTVVDTGLTTTLGGRILQVQEYIGVEDFIVVHGDCLSNIDIDKLVHTHDECGKIATLAVARPTGRNAILPIHVDGLWMQDGVAELPENQAWVNACCKVFKSNIFNYLLHTSDLGMSLFSLLSKENEIITYKHYGFWSPIETKRDYSALQGMWDRDEAPWKIW